METTSRIVLTADGSHSVYNAEVGQHYHSVNGAKQESERVFIELGLQAAFERFADEPLRLFEMGFGTGLNALLTLQEAEKHKRSVHYEAVETQPLSLEEVGQLNFDALLGTNHQLALHQAPWGMATAITPTFTLTRHPTRLQDFRTTEPFHLIYFDAFPPGTQPELWTVETFTQMARMLVPGGILTTYCSKSSVQHNLKAAGFRVEKHPGPRYKRNVLRAVF